MFSFFRKYITYQKDKSFVQKQAFERLGRKINWKSPQTYNDYVNLIKIDPKSERLWIYVDKWEVRKFVKKKVGGGILNKIYDVYNNVDEIQLDKLPNKFVLKATHGSGWNIICKDKKNLNWRRVKAKLERWLETNYYDLYKERMYRQISPQIICEKYLKDKNRELRDYKFWCWYGNPKFVQVDINRFTKNMRRNFYDTSWNKLPFSKLYTRTTKTIKQPKNFEKMIKIVEDLSANFTHVLIDLYNVNGKIYFGEITFIPGSGLNSFKPDKYNYLIGQYF